MGQLEDYILGKPLNAENAALMNGEEPAAQRPQPAQETMPVNVSGELTEEDREWLRRLFHEPGYQIFLRLLDCAIHNREESAKLLSSTDPLGNSQEVIKEWTYITCFKTVIRDMKALVQENMAAS